MLSSFRGHTSRWKTRGTHLTHTEKELHSVKSYAEAHPSADPLEQRWDQGAPVRGERSPSSLWPEHCSTPDPETRHKEGHSSPSSGHSAHSSLLSPLFVEKTCLAMSPLPSHIPGHISLLHHADLVQICHFLIHIL